MQERSAYVVYLNFKLVRIFSSGAHLGEVEIEKSTITLKYATDAESIYILGYEWHKIMYTIKSDPKRHAYRVWL